MTDEPESLPPETTRAPQPARRVRPLTLIMAVVAIAAIGFVANLKLSSARINQAITTDRVLTQQQRAAADAEISAMIEQAYLGESKNQEQLALVARVGAALAAKSDARSATAPLRFHLLAEANSINLFALNSGDIYLTTALLNRMKTEGELAGALALGAAHVMAGNSPEPLAQAPGALPLWRYTPEQEIAVDAIAANLMGQAGYDPNAMIGMFTTLLAAYQTRADVAFFVTHPNKPDRLQKLYTAIQTLYPKGIPAELSK